MVRMPLSTFDLPAQVHPVDTGPVRALGHEKCTRVLGDRLLDDQSLPHCNSAVLWRFNFCRGLPRCDCTGDRPRWFEERGNLFCSRIPPRASAAIPFSRVKRQWESLKPVAAAGDRNRQRPGSDARSRGPSSKRIACWPEMISAKLGRDFGPYMILRACNPPLAFDVITTQRLGLLVSLRRYGRGSPTAALAACRGLVLEALTSSRLVR